MSVEWTFEDNEGLVADFREYLAYVGFDEAQEEVAKWWVEFELQEKMPVQYMAALNCPTNQQILIDSFVYLLIKYGVKRIKPQLDAARTGIPSAHKTYEVCFNLGTGSSTPIKEVVSGYTPSQV